MTAAAPLPSFLVIGAVKAATTWLHGQLQAHPEIYLPDPEPHFFSREYDRGLDFYRTFFADAEPHQVVGEKSADYLAHPLAPARVAASLRRAPLVVQLRNPVDRAYSDYKMLYRRGTVTGDPERYLTPGRSEQPRFLDDGLYARHLERWFDHFAPGQLLVLLYEDVKQDPQGTVNRVCDHIGVTRHYREDVGAQRFNDGAEQFLPLSIRRALAPIKDAVQPLRGHAAFEVARSLLAREIRYPPLAPDLRARLQDHYATDIEALERLIGRDLGNWLPSAARRPQVASELVTQNG